MKLFGPLFALTTLFVALPMRAHHSTSAEFEMTKKVTLSGTRMKVDWINPHIAVEVEAKGADGKDEIWKFESGPPAWFTRAGVNRDDLIRAIGQTIIVEGVPAKNGTPYSYLQKITFADGVVLESWRNAPKLLKRGSGE